MSPQSRPQPFPQWTGRLIGFLTGRKTEGEKYAAAIPTGQRPTKRPKNDTQPLDARRGSRTQYIEGALLTERPKQLDALRHAEKNHSADYSDDQTEATNLQLVIEGKKIAPPARN